MDEELNPDELRVIRTRAWMTLESRYSDDPTFSLVRSLDRQIAAMSAPFGKRTSGEQQAGPAPDDLDDVSKMIETTSIKLFKEAITKPAYGRVIVPELRRLRVPLHEDDRKATSAITAVYAKRPKIFKKFPGKGLKSTSKWHLQPGV